MPDKEQRESASSPEADNNNATLIMYGKAQQMKEEIGRSYTRRSGVQRGYLGEALRYCDVCLNELTQGEPGHISRAVNSLTRAACLAGHAGRMV